MEIVLNGEHRYVPDGATLAALIETLGLKPELVVAQRNSDIVERDQFPQTRLAPGDELELVHVVGGG